jgi:hypothetical protein
MLLYTLPPGAVNDTEIVGRRQSMDMSSPLPGSNKCLCPCCIPSVVYCAWDTVATTYMCVYTLSPRTLRTATDAGPTPSVGAEGYRSDPYMLDLLEVADAKVRSLTEDLEAAQANNAALADERDRLAERLSRRTAEIERLTKALEGGMPQLFLQLPAIC